MKSILISIQPKWVEKILNKRKTIEVRKGTALYKAITKLIEQYGEATLYVYCTKNGGLLFRECKTDSYFCEEENKNYRPDYVLNGKVVAMFTCKKVEDIACNCLENGVGLDTYYMTDELECDELEVRSWLSGSELRNYLGIGKCISSGTVGTAIYIDDLVIFDKPKELSEFYKVGFDKALKESLRSEPYPICSVRIEKQYQLTKAPQSFMFIESENEND